MNSYPELQGRVAIVTGATTGIGKSIAICLAREGVDIAVVGRDKERGQIMETALIEQGTKSFFARCDVSSPEEVEATVNETVRRFDRVDILINCAGGFTKRAKASEYTVAEWNEMIDSNLRSAFLFTRLVLLGMVERRWGRIVNISSGSAQGVPFSRGYRM